jgi:hypothetical protein
MTCGNIYTVEKVYGHGLILLLKEFQSFSLAKLSTVFNYEESIDILIMKKRKDQTNFEQEVAKFSSLSMPSTHHSERKLYNYVKGPILNADISYFSFLHNRRFEQFKNKIRILILPSEENL